MSSPQAIVSKVLTFSCVDGPGNRLVLFLQGCNFRCPTCHNPHTIDFCNDCGECIPACHVEALSLVAGKINFDPTHCDQCDACIKACPISANPMVLHYSVEDVLDTARQNLPFLTGITVSGGEATVQLKFVKALFTAVKQDEKLRNLTCFIDSNGHLGAAGWKELLPVTDGVMLDIKAFSKDLHMELTGKGNERVLESARILKAAGKLHEIRYLLIPDRSDKACELDQLGCFMLELGHDTRLRLNAYQHHGVSGSALTIAKMQEAHVRQIATTLRAQGFPNITTPALYL
ncbi:YjjW family glycine radical enzyme activase [Flexibacterium corallicola]|uniref:YjjW family glycine radical enzyme activase n=1 Tax=Flexibacterium corallicola TaxID=3037259 RepID=UPI00286F5A9E|nr:YjjW family glycine radical enzyme activase [Pseudovibrio sp. M1P-2-3]